MSRDRWISTRKPVKLTMVATAGALSVAAAATAAAAAWPSGSPAATVHRTTAASSVTSAFAILRQPGNQPAGHEIVLTTLARTQAAAHRAAAAQPATHRSATHRPATPSSPQSIAQSMLNSFGWPPSEFSCLEPLWAHESGWNVTAANPSTGAYGIPQAEPGSKMASAGPDWKSDAATQVKWGLGYIKDTYGSPCAAWRHEQADGWY